MGRLFLAFVTALISLSFVPLAHADSPSTILVEVIDSKGFSYVGELLQDEGDSVTIFDLRSGKERVIERSWIKEIKNDISDEAAIAETDLPSVMAWKVKKLNANKSQVGRVAKVSSSVVYLTLGAKDGIAEGQKLSIYRNNGDIIDPVTKKVIAQDRPHIAEVQVIEAQDAYSKAKILGDIEIQLQAGDECEIPSLKMCVAVFPLVDTEGKVSEAGQAMTEDLTTSLVQHGVPVVERALLNQVITELALQNTVLFDEKQAQQIGMQAGASCVLTGKIVTDDNRNVAHVRLIDVRTGKILMAASERMKGLAIGTSGIGEGNTSGGGSSMVGASSIGTVSGADLRPAEPKDDKIIADDETHRTAEQMHGPTKAYALKIDAKDPLVRVNTTAIYFQAINPSDADTIGHAEISLDYGKTWATFYKWELKDFKAAKRRDGWFVVDLAPVVKKKPNLEVDEVDVRYSIDGIVNNVEIDRVIWARK
jgi:TolB-like protein